MASGRALKIWALIILVATLIVTRQGLFDELGYDISVVVALMMAVVIPHVTALRVADLRHSRAARHRLGLDFTLATYSHVVGGGVFLLLIPIAVFLVRGTWRPHCDFGEGLLWYLIIAGITTLYVSSLGLFFALATRRVRTALLLSYLFVILTFVVALRHVVADPPIFFFNGAMGYFPGPIYDEKVTITTALIWARAGTLTWSILFLAASVAMCDLRRMRLDVTRFMELDLSFGNLAPRITVLMCLAAVLALHLGRHANGTSPDAGDIQRTLGGRAETEHFVIYFDHNTKDAEEIERLVEDHEFRLRQLLDFLGWDDLPQRRKLESYIYPSPAVKKALMGAESTSFADPWNRVMHINDEPFPHPSLKHEMAHLVSASFAGRLGFSTRIGLHEGFAVAADWEETRLTPDQWASAMKRQSVLPDMSSLLSATGFWGEASSRAYLATGSFVRYLIDTHGVESFLPFFRDGNGEKHYGIPTDSLVARWNAGLDTVAVSAADLAYAETILTRGAIFGRRCPRQAALMTERAWNDLTAGRHPAAEAAFDRLLQWSPGNPSHLIGKLRLLRRTERTDEAAVLARLLAAPGDTAGGGGRNAAIGHDVLGDMAWNAGRPDSARVHYEMVIRNGSVEHLVRGAHAKIAVLGHEGGHEGYRRVLAESPGAAERAAVLARLAVAGPERGVARYLLGRQLYNDRAWGPSAEQLASAATERLPDVSIRAECLWLLGKARYRLDDLDGASKSFSEIITLDRNEAEKLRAQAWLARCRHYEGDNSGLE